MFAKIFQTTVHTEKCIQKFTTWFVNKLLIGDLSMNLIQEANQLQIDLQTGLQTGHKLPISLAQKLFYQTGQCQFVLCR